MNVEGLALMYASTRFTPISMLQLIHILAVLNYSPKIALSHAWILQFRFKFCDLRMQFLLKIISKNYLILYFENKNYYYWNCVCDKTVFWLWLGIIKIADMWIGSTTEIFIKNPTGVTNFSRVQLICLFLYYRQCYTLNAEIRCHCYL